MRRLVYPPAARRDFVALRDHLARESSSLLIAQRFVAVLRDQCTKLATLPGMLGRARPELGPDIRSFPHKGYVIFFRYEPDAFIVLRVLHGNRNIDAQYDRQGHRFSQAVFVVSSAPQWSVANAGLKAFGMDHGN